MRSSPKIRAAISLAALAVLISGCTFSDPDGSTMSTQEQFDELMKRPDADQAKQSYKAMQSKIRGALSERLDLAEWRENSGTDHASPCGDFADVSSFDKLTFSLPSWSTRGALSDDQWSQGLKIVRRIGADYGFTKVALEHRGGEISTFELTDGHGASIHLMDNPQSRLVLQVDAGCHLDPEAKKRGRPMNEEEEESYWKKPDSSAPTALPPQHSPATEHAAAADSERKRPTGTQPRQQAEPTQTPTPNTPPRSRPLRQDDDEDFDDINFLR